ncbi:terpenoid synthase [Lentinus tigrinus ALCF2SS1-6]|uniref:Terpenoid synthase n=1 Tax=Lentinus tigrinus ALCF2SS1-6 TaxID=1328759 RepID=A0A5C2SEW8_9APHY|nr:terpenoid synthase [Lentinus tigrinus ALCF2SS1-6]
MDSLADIKDVIRDFLAHANYKSPGSECDVELRTKLAAELALWPTDINPAVVSKILDGSCVYAETTYGHTTSQHRFFIALYTACLMYVDDLGERDLDAVMRFTGRFAKGEEQPNPVLNRLAGLLRQAHELWTQYGADAIIAGTLDAVTAMYVEYTAQALVIKPSATRFPYYLRTRAGIGPPYIHFVFMNSWRPTPQSYLQLLPYMEHWTLGTNLSFYKEELAGETNNYVHLRAAAEETSATDVLRELVNEVLETAGKMSVLTSQDPELAALWEKYFQGYLEFSLKAKRYRLAELGYQA